MAIKRHGKITRVLLSINLIPLLVFSVVLLSLGNHFFTKAMYAEVQNELTMMAKTIIDMTDAAYPGDYELMGKNALKLYKGETDFTTKFDLVDTVKENTGLDVTIFYHDTRILTTLTDTSGKRITGSGANETVLDSVLRQGTPQFYDRVMIYGTDYFTYYTPLYNSNNVVVGMLSVGKPTEQVNKAVLKAVHPLLIAIILLMAVIAIFITLYMNKFGSAVESLKNFLKEVSTGNLSATMSQSVLDRHDELSDISKSALSMQRSLHTLVEQDALTTLHNRRSGDRLLKQAVSKYTASGEDFCVCIGDIDFFKKVNDTYGHDCGDLILKNVAYKLKQFMRGNGFVARWGGEEFLLVFEKKNLDQSKAILEALLDDIRAMESEYDGKIVKVTMSYGLTTGSTDDVTELLRLADEKLYRAKTSGRNQIVTE